MASYDYEHGCEDPVAAPALPLGLVLARNAPLLRAFGLLNPPDQILGRGRFGAAYKLGANGKETALKLTRDVTEAQAACLLVGQAPRRIVRVHGIWALRNTYRPGLGLWWFAIHREYLLPLTQTDKDLIEMLFSLYAETDYDLVIPRNAHQHAMFSKWRGYFRDMLMGETTKRTDHEGMTVGGGSRIDKQVKRGMQLLLSMGSAVDEMHRFGVDWEDIHSDNWMRNAQGKLVIADVGLGEMHEDFERTVPPLTADAVREHLGRAWDSTG